LVWPAASMGLLLLAGCGTATDTAAPNEPAVVRLAVDREEGFTPRDLDPWSETGKAKYATWRASTREVALVTSGSTGCMPYARQAKLRTDRGVVSLWLRNTRPSGRDVVCAGNLIPVTFTLNLAGTESEPRILVVKDPGFGDRQYELDGT
jgi:hypothetical protein